MAEFIAPHISDNVDGWGPPLDEPPEKFADMPYAPFSKSDRLGRAADWFSHGRYGNRGDEGEFGADEDNAGFTLVDNRPTQRQHTFSNRGRDRNFGRNRNWNDRDNFFRRDFRRDNRRFGGFRYDDRRNQNREASVEIGTNWEMLEEMPFQTVLAKARFDEVGNGETLRECGSLEYYDKANERISCKMEKPLKWFGQRAFHSVTTAHDPIIRELASEGAGNVFATSEILSLLMTSTRSSYPWDLVVQRVGDKLFFDKRDGLRIEYCSVNETAHEQPKDAKNATSEEAINTIQSLAKEATLINQNFSQAMLVQNNERFKLEESNPFTVEGEEEASVAYRYRRWNVGPEITLVARCEIDGAIKPSGPNEEPTFLVIKALNEVMDPNMRQVTDWRGKLDKQRGAVLATEVKNNAAKVARWISQALLSGADQMLIGFVSRINPRDNSNHVVLGTQLYKPREFSSQNALTQTNMWGILKLIVEACYKHIPSGGKGVLLKDPNSPLLKLYSVPEDAFEEEAEEGFAEDEGDGK